MQPIFDWFLDFDRLDGYSYFAFGMVWILKEFTLHFIAYFQPFPAQ